MKNVATKIERTRAAIADIQAGIAAAESIGWASMADANRRELAAAQARLAKLQAKQ